jgi:CBS domain-containing protein
VAARTGAVDGALEARISELAEERVTLPPDVALDEAMALIADANVRWAPVVEDGRVVGRLGIRDVVRAYKSTLRQSVRRVTALPPETVLFEVVVAASSPLVGLSLADASLPSDTLVVSILRDGEIVFPRASTEVVSGDRLTVRAPAGDERAVRAHFET